MEPDTTPFPVLLPYPPENVAVLALSGATRGFVLIRIRIERTIPDILSSRHKYLNKLRIAVFQKG
jgi:hypothetical protein